MAINIAGASTGAIAEVDPTFKAVYTTARPIHYGTLGFYRVSGVSGTMAASLGANSEIFQFRWAPLVVPSALAVLYKLSIEAGANVAATGAGATVAIIVSPARKWTVAGTGGTRLDMTGPSCRLRCSMNESMVNDIGVATTAALTAGTKVIDTVPIAGTHFAVSLAAITASLPFNLITQRDGDLWDVDGCWPFVMMPTDGFVIRNTVAMPASLTWNFCVNATWAEVSEF